MRDIKKSLLVIMIFVTASDASDCEDLSYSERSTHLSGSENIDKYDTSCFLKKTGSLESDKGNKTKHLTLSDIENKKRRSSFSEKLRIDGEFAPEDYIIFTIDERSTNFEYSKDHNPLTGTAEGTVLKMYKKMQGKEKNGHYENKETSEEKQLLCSSDPTGKGRMRCSSFSKKPCNTDIEYRPEEALSAYIEYRPIDKEK